VGGSALVGRSAEGFDLRDRRGELLLELRRLRLGNRKRAVWLSARNESDFRHGPLDRLAAVAAADFGPADLDRLAGADAQLAELIHQDGADCVGDVEGTLFGAEHVLNAAELRLDGLSLDRAQTDLDRNVGLKLDDWHYAASSLTSSLNSGTQV
jgi:hypothetical protein